MPLYQVVVLAVVQGVTEFLPVSSTAHLVLVPWIFGWKDPGLAFDMALHLGTLAAVAAYFVKTWLRLLFLAFGRRALPARATEPDHDLYSNPRLFWYLVAATVPAGVAGLALESYIETTWRSPLVIGSMMIVIAGVLWWSERIGRFDKDLGRMTLADSLAVGAAQALALAPGVSRSGITMAAALVRGVNRTAAARFSFLLSTPIIAGAVAKEALDLVRQGLPAGMAAPFAVGIVVSGLSGYLVIAFFIRFLQTRTFNIFIWYRLVCGIIILALAIFFRDPVATP